MQPINFAYWSNTDDDERTSGPSHLEPTIYELGQWRWWTNSRPLPSRTNNLWTRPMAMMNELQAPPISNQQSMNSTNGDDERTPGPSHLEPTIYELGQWRWWTNSRPLPSQTNNLWTRPMAMSIKLQAPCITDWTIDSTTVVASMEYSGSMQIHYVDSGRCNSWESFRLKHETLELKLVNPPTPIRSKKFDPREFT